MLVKENERQSVLIRQLITRITEHGNVPKDTESKHLTISFIWRLCIGFL